MGCKNAKFSIEDWYMCELRGDSCIFINPISEECARRFKEGRNAIEVDDRETMRRRK